MTEVTVRVVDHVEFMEHSGNAHGPEGDLLAAGIGYAVLGVLSGDHVDNPEALEEMRGTLRLVGLDVEADDGQT